MTSPPLAESRLPVGSSARSTSGLPGDRAGHRHALLLAARELRRVVVQPVQQAHPLQGLVRRAPALARPACRDSVSGSSTFS